jgi:hypothetical protein
MRKILSAVVLTVLILVLANNGLGQSRQNTAYFAAFGDRRVDISRRGALVASLSIPEGVLMSITHDAPRPVIASARRQFSGDLTIRVQPGGTSKPRPPDPSRRAEVIMSTAPFVLTISGMDVVVEDLGR